MPALDRRVRRTREALARALLQLAAERPFADVTIRELTAVADVGYATFFRHYQNKEELLLDVLGGIVDELADLLQPSAEAGRLEDAGRDLFAYVAGHATALRVLFDAQRSGTVERELRSAVCARVLASPSFAPPPGVPADLAAHHLTAASLALVGWWLDHDMPYPPEVMANAYARLVAAPTLTR
ncbi:MAG: TetR/AcrR family transcriptional regulator [Trueperaceae bacterium]|nr:TetR/AcrR family transcriptional regulator [Trueperaceae bacterium]